MQLHLNDNVGCDNWLWQDVGKVVGQGFRWDTFDWAARQFTQGAETINITLITLDRDEVDSHTVGLGKLTDSFVEFIDLLDLFVSFCFIVSSETLVG